MNRYLVGFKGAFLSRKFLFSLQLTPKVPFFLHSIHCLGFFCATGDKKHSQFLIFVIRNICYILQNASKLFKKHSIMTCFF